MGSYYIAYGLAIVLLTIGILMGNDVLPARGGMELLPPPPSWTDSIEKVLMPPESQAECVRMQKILRCTSTSLTGELPHEETAEIAPEVKEEAL